MMELRVWLSSLGKRGSDVKFLVIGRPRSGTTLLTRLLNQVPSIQCDPELLHYAVLSPRHLIKRLAAKSDAQAYGCKWLSYQMLEVQHGRDIRRILEDLSKDGFQFIHLKRNSFDQLKSLMIAHQAQRYSSLEKGKTDALDLRLESDDFRKALDWSDASLDFETQLLQGLPTLSLSYEDDLEDATRHQETIDRICAFLGTEPGPVRADVRREKLATIQNLQELQALSHS